ncbi:tetratricopeptide repeat protein [Caldisericum sp.]|uniref:tetratricopeptide repeat protein n=1 Tax=Caldisericum sp. TaxID=2499687 RepID=UPI003D0BAB51
MIKRVPKIFISFIILGYIFAFFSLFDPTKRLFGLISFVIAAILHIVFITTNEYQSSRHLALASKYIEKNIPEKSYEEILKSAKLYENEEELYKLFYNKTKYKDTVKKVANIIYENINEHDTPYLRFIGSTLEYIAGDLEKAKRLLIEIEEEKLTIKMVRLLGSIFYESKDFDKAIEYLSLYDPPYAPMNEDELAVVYGLGISYLQKGDRKKAQEYLERVELRNPKFGNVSQILKSLESDSKES